MSVASHSLHLPNIVKSKIAVRLHKNCCQQPRNHGDLEKQTCRFSVHDRVPAKRLYELLGVDQPIRHGIHAPHYQAKLLIINGHVDVVQHPPEFTFTDVGVWRTGRQNSDGAVVTKDRRG